ncbi:hypothetical protein BVRB_6g135840 [Beta vulgaris subsp. vulgaris]|nr:hypothetical protein BVRB_6g135840 [Beta vulgaris subsp. vulgaris]
MLVLTLRLERISIFWRSIEFYDKLELDDKHALGGYGAFEDIDDSGINVI